MRNWVLVLAILTSACAPRHSAVTAAAPITAGAGLIGNDGGSLIGNDGGSLINNGGSTIQETLPGKLVAPRAADAVDADDRLITLGSGTGQASSDLTALPVVGATVTVREVRTLAALAGQTPQTTNAVGRFNVGSRPADTTILFEASGTTGDGKTLRLLGLFAKEDPVSLDLASTLAAVRALAPGAAAAAKRGTVQLAPVRTAIATSLKAHPTEALAAAKLLASDSSAPFSFGTLVDLEDALVTLGQADATLQPVLDQLDASL